MPAGSVLSLNRSSTASSTTPGSEGNASGSSASIVPRAERIVTPLRAHDAIRGGAGLRADGKRAPARRLSTSSPLVSRACEVRREFLADRTFSSIHVAQQALDAWVLEYNTTRPHQALEIATPAERFRLTPLAKGRASVPVDSGEDHNGQWVLRRVGSNGMVSVDNQLAAARKRTQRSDYVVCSSTARSRRA